MPTPPFQKDETIWLSTPHLSLAWDTLATPIIISGILFLLLKIKTLKPYQLAISTGIGLFLTHHLIIFLFTPATEVAEYLIWYCLSPTLFLALYNYISINNTTLRFTTAMTLGYVLREILWIMYLNIIGEDIFFIFKYSFNSTLQATSSAIIASSVLGFHLGTNKNASSNLIDRA